MIEIRIPKEVTKYEPKLLGPFNSRQCIALAICVPIISILYTNLSEVINSTIAAYVCLPIAGIGALFGWVKPYGLTFEKYMKSVFVNSFIAPTKRLYKTENYFDVVSKASKALTAEELVSLDLNLGYIPEAEANQILESLQNNKTLRKKVKYQKSKKAVF